MLAETEMKIKTLEPWFGGKRTLAPTIVEELGPHRAYFEPMAGGVSVIFQKPRCRMEVINDLHGDITNLAKVVASETWAPLLYSRCVRTLYSEGIYEDCRAAIVKDFDFDGDPLSLFDRAYCHLVLSWMGRNGAAGTAHINYQFTLRYTSNGGDSATRWSNVTTSIPAWHDRLRGVVITRRDAFQMLDKIDDADGVAIYLDPPYFDEGSAYEHRFESGGGIFGDDHKRLSDAAARFKRARVVISYYDHRRIAELYPGWTKRLCTMQKSLAVQNKRGTQRTMAPEVLLLNGPSFASKN